MSVYTSVQQLIGMTPLLELTRDPARILAKLEFCNPAGSVKDRAALSMLNNANLPDNAVVIEPTSGNTGIGLCALCAARGLKCIIVMPDTMSIERQRLMKAYGAKVILTPGALGMAGAIAEAERLAAQTEHSFLAGQFYNSANPLAHYQTTGPEIWADTNGTVDIFVAGVGTGGTVSGVGKFLREKNPHVQIVAVEPEKSPVLSGGTAGSHGIQGIGAGFVPENCDLSLVDEIFTVTDDCAFETARDFAKAKGLLIGISAGAAFYAATALANRPENAGKTIVTVFPDSGERYLSTRLYD